MSFTSINPTTGSVIASYAEDTPAEVEGKLATAWEGWQNWSKKPIEARTAFLVRLAELLEQRADDYAALIVAEMGKPFGEAKGEVIKSATGARHFATEGPKYIADEPIPGTPSKIVYQPLGPIFGIMPWNLPFWQVLQLFHPRRAGRQRRVGEARRDSARRGAGHRGSGLRRRRSARALRQSRNPEGSLVFDRRRSPRPRRNRHRQRGRWARRGAAGGLAEQEGGARTWRLGSLYRLRRRRHGQSREARIDLALFQQRAKLYRREAIPCRALGVRTITSPPLPKGPKA